MKLLGWIVLGVFCGSALLVGGYFTVIGFVDGLRERHRREKGWRTR